MGLDTVSGLLRIVVNGVEVVLQLMHFLFSKKIFRSPMSRVKFNNLESEWSNCMATCPKYNRATVPYFTTKAELEGLVSWQFDTTTDPITKSLYPEAFSPTIWIPIRFVLCIFSINSKFLSLVIMSLKDSLKISTVEK